MKMNLFAHMKDLKRFQWFKLRVSGHLKHLLIITVLLETVWPHGLIRLWIDLLWGNHHIILCTTLKCALRHVMVLGVGSVIKVYNRMAVMAIRLSRLIPRIMHQPAGPVSDHEEGCRWSGECR